MRVIIGTRGSKLALKQVEEVKDALLKVEPTLEIEVKVIKTIGDQNQTAPISSLGSNGVFTSVIEEALVNKEIDIAVHSLKDVPSMTHEDLCFLGTIQAQDPRDCLVFKNGYHSLDDILKGGVIATCSKRREHLIRKLRPDLKIVGIRGNVDTRLKKLETENIDATILAVAGLNRLNKQEVIGQYLSIDEMIPSPAQGILGIQTRKDAKINKIIEKIIDEKSTKRMQLERLFLTAINGSCKDAIGCHIEINESNCVIHAMYGNDEHYQIIQETVDEHIEEHIIQIAKELKERIHE